MGFRVSFFKGNIARLFVSWNDQQRSRVGEQKGEEREEVDGEVCRSESGF